MPCDTARRPEQTIEQRADEIRASIVKLNSLLASGKVRAKVGPQGAIAFVGWNEADRGRVTDACAYRRVMATGSALAKTQIAQAEMMAGRTVDRIVVGQGIHSHDGGRTWHGKG